MSDTLARLSFALEGRYRLERELGAGGMATVFLAHDLRHDRDVAIKVLHPDLGAALGGDRFLSEIRTTARLQHPHILPLLDSGDAGGLLYYVMPLVTGETLRARLARERVLPIDEALLVAREVADALAYAHQHGVIHRDIKPENILLQGGHALVADFGIALAVQSAGGARMTQTGLSLGTPQYMSPEQAMGERTIDARSDVYALGAVTYEMLTGDPPFTGSSVQAIVAKVMTEKPVAPRVVRDTVPAGVEQAVLRALAKLPADRFASATQFAAALEAPAAAGAMAAAPIPRRASPVVPALAAVAGLALGATAAWWAWHVPAAPGGGGERVVSSSILLPDSIPLEPTRINTEGMPTLALSPDGSILVFVGRKGEVTQLYRRQLSSFEIRPIEGTDGAVAPFFSPKGDEVAFFVDSRLKRVSLADGKVTQVAQGLSETWGGVWTEDGRFIIANDRAQQILVVAASGDSIGGARCPESCSLPDVLPDGRHLLVSGNGIRVLDLESGSLKPLARWRSADSLEALRGSMARYDGDGHLVWVDPAGSLMAAPFDPQALALRGAPVTLAQGVRLESGRGGAQAAVARSGLVAYAPGPLMSVGILVRATRAGKLDTIPAPKANYSKIEVSPDGERVLVRESLPNSDTQLQVIDVATGHVTPWITSRPPIRDLGWLAGGRRVWFLRGGWFYIGDPSTSSPPDSVRTRPGGGLVIGDAERFLMHIGDTLFLSAARGGGDSLRLPVERAASASVLPDSRWVVSQEFGSNGSSLVARRLDRSGRRIVVSNDRSYGMSAVPSGTNEVIVAKNERDPGDNVVRALEEQTFFSIPYDPGNEAAPFGTPRLLFSARVADFPGRNYGVGMHGQRFVFKQRIATPDSREVRLLYGWHDALRR